MNQKILVADDHVVVRLGIEMLIRNNTGLTIHLEHATSGDIVLALLHQQDKHYPIIHHTSNLVEIIM